MPPDAKVVTLFSSGTIFDDLQRWANDHKFYTTLPHKIDNAVEEYFAATEETPEPTSEFWEEEDGETPLGGPMGISSVLQETNTSKDSSDN